MIKAINPKHQAVINRFIKANKAYDRIVDETEDNGGLRQQRAYDKAFELFDSLPLRERNNLAKYMQTGGY